MSAPDLTDVRMRALLPEPTSVIPPVTLGRIRRALAVYAVLWLAGLIPLLAGAPTSWRAAGLGLAFPGGGLAYGGHWLLAAIALTSTALSVVLWWTLGPAILPPLVWVGSAIAGSLVAGRVSTGAAVVALAAVPVAATTIHLVHRFRHAGQVRTGRSLNQQLAVTEFTVTGHPGDDVREPVVEHSEDDLKRLRYALDLALQPLDEFRGFNRLDQFREGALRYQVNMLGWSLSMSQFTRTPAFTGYLAQAQRNAIEKMLHRKVWGYWALENAWGRLSLNKDPVDTPENIMLGGYHGLMLGLYSALNDDRYTRPGSLTFRWNERTSYPHDAGTIAACTHRNMVNSAYTLFACEPNWIYPICNTMGMNTLLSHDRDHPTGYFADLQHRLRTGYDQEFLRPDGRLIGVRSNHLGLSWNFWSGEAVQLSTAYWLHATMPDVAHRTWWLVKQKLDETGALPRSASNRLDPGNYRLGRETYGRVLTMLTARELGDEDVAARAQAALDERERVAESNGASKYADASAFTNLYANLARFSRHSAMRDLLTYGTPDAWKTGPVLAEASYPDVLVAKAVSYGADLELVLRPGNGPVRADLRLERLVPHRTYRVTGAEPAELIASAFGDARLTVTLGDRTVVRVTPT
ncbi:MAG: hypothetical protein ACJ71Z_03185 [Aeromicrobium sp.]